MLNRVKIQNFKSIGEPGVDLELKPITFLVGPNGGGKSSILEAIAYAAQGRLSGQLIRHIPDIDLLHKPNSTTALHVDVYFDQEDLQDNDLGQRVRTTFHDGGSGTNRENLHGDEVLITNDQETTNFMKTIEEVSSEKFNPNTYLMSSIRGKVPSAVNVGADISPSVMGGNDPEWVGVEGQYLIYILTKIFGRREFSVAENKIVYWANKFGMEGLKAGLWERLIVGADYIDPEIKSSLNLALSSAGSKQILTVITQLFWSPKGSLLMIEEPEISLHPKAQIDVLEMFAEAINEEDKQIIATTHGLFLIQAIGYAVQKGWLRADQVAVHHIEKRKDTGTVSKQLPVDEKGYIKGWIPSFASVERRLLEEAIKNIPEEQS